MEVNYLFATGLDKSDGSYNTVEHPFGKIYLPNKTENVNLKIL